MNVQNPTVRDAILDLLQLDDGGSSSPGYGSGSTESVRPRALTSTALPQDTMEPIPSDPLTDRIADLLTGNEVQAAEGDDATGEVPLEAGAGAGTEPGEETAEFPGETAEPVEEGTDPEVDVEEPPTVLISSFDDDPFAQEAVVESLPLSAFFVDENGTPIGLIGPRVEIIDAQNIVRIDNSFNFIPIANNPFSKATVNAEGNFVFPDEARFPIHSVETNAFGEPLVDANGLQVWTPREVHLGQTTAFESIHGAITVSEQWASRTIGWGDGQQISVNPHEFVDLNAFYSPQDRGLHFGIVLYQDGATDEIRVFELSSSWEVATHEAGHAIHDALKPNALPVDEPFNGFGQFGESFGDQLAMWTSLQDPDRVQQILAESDGDLRNPNALAKIGESMGILLGRGDSLRDALNGLRVSDTTPQVHDRSQVLTGATYQVFAGVVDTLQTDNPELTDAEALAQAGEIMGTLLTRSSDYMPENIMTLEDVAKAYVKADAELFDGRFQDLLVAEFEAREIFEEGGFFSDGSFEEWQEHESNIPSLSLEADTDLQALVDENLAALNVPDGFGLRIQSDEALADGGRVVRVELTDGTGADADSFLNAGILTFRADGTLADYHGALDPSIDTGDLLTLVSQAREAGIDTIGPMAIIPDGEGGHTVAVFQESAGAQDPHIMRYSIDTPEGERLEYSFREEFSERVEKFEALLPEGATIVQP